MAQKLLRLTPPRVVRLVIIFAIIVAVIAVIGFVVGYYKASTTQHNQADLRTTATSETTKRKDLAPAGTGSVKPVSDPAQLDAFIVGPGGDIKSEADVLNVHRRNAKDPFAVGAVDAPVVISEFSDFECPFCALYVNGARKQILSEYVDQGLVRLEWNDFPINGPNAVAAAKAGRAAAAQGKFHEFHDALYQASAGVKGHPENKTADFVRFAKEAGVPDLAKFEEQATDSTYDEVIKKAQGYGSSLGIDGVPAALVGTQFVSGAQPIEVFRQVIEAELVKAKAKTKSA